MRDASLCYRELATRVRQHKLGKRSRRRGSIKPMAPEAARSCWESSLKLLAHVEMIFHDLRCINSVMIAPFTGLRFN